MNAEAEIVKCCENPGMRKICQSFPEERKNQCGSFHEEPRLHKFYLYVVSRKNEKRIKCVVTSYVRDTF